MRVGPLVYWNTVRHLQPRQVFGRVRLRLTRPLVDARPAPPLRTARPGRWVMPARRAASLVGDGRFVFLNEERTLAAHGWDNPAVPKLWRYNLHYFDDLNASGAAGRRRLHEPLLARWIRENPPGSGTGWEPFPTSVRMVNWIKWVLGGNRPPDRMVESLAVQARWLTGRLETHLLGNHLLANAKALVFAGLFFNGIEAESWLERGRSILAEQVAEQVLGDGGHIERSPMYHALVLEDLLDVYNIGVAYAVAKGPRADGALEGLADTVSRMRDWLNAMCHPDGEIAFFNDSALGIGADPAELERYARDLGLGTRPGPSGRVTELRESGYLRLVRDRVVVLLDVAEVGPDYQPGHAHADTLSFELSVDGQRVIVNSGTSRYGTDLERLRQRGTAAHNTVVVGGRDSSEVWGGFRVARRARPFDLEVAPGDDIRVGCAHDGYRRLPGRPVHRRRWTVADGSLVIDDEVRPDRHPGEARFHIHPDVQIDPGSAGAGAGQLRLRSGAAVKWRVMAGDPVLEAATFHPRFGASVANACLAVRLAGGRSRVCFDVV